MRELSVADIRGLMQEMRKHVIEPDADGGYHMRMRPGMADEAFRLGLRPFCIIDDRHVIGGYAPPTE